MSRRFRRRIEDFVCVHCGLAVRGDGFTNHCPACLWSRHVDINPGDRAADCGGRMAPVAIETTRDGHRVTHRCRRCGHEKRNRVADTDSRDRILALYRRQADGRDR